MAQKQNESELEQAEPHGSGDVKPSIDKNDERIVKQIEYYFGDFNLPRDKFLLEEVKKGWVSLDVMLKFNRLAQITTDVDEITNAISNLSTLIEVNQRKDSIRRRLDCPLPENKLEYWKGVKKRTVYVKGFPLDSNIDVLLAFFQSKWDIVNLWMRKTKVGEPRTFKGSVFVTFNSEEAAKEFADSETPLTYKNQPLIKCMQEQYWAIKNKENKAKKAEQRALKQAKNAEVAKDQLESLKAAHYVKGVVLKVTGLPSTITLANAKEFFKKFERVAYVKLELDKNTAYVRFDSREENTADTAWKKALEEGEGKVVFKLDGDETVYELTGEVLTGDEESAYWVEFNNRRLSVKNDNKRKAKDRGAKGKRNARKRGFVGDDGEAPKSKRIVFDDDGNPVASDVGGGDAAEVLKNEENESADDED